MEMEGNLDYENIKLSKFGFKMKMSSFIVDFHKLTVTLILTAEILIASSG